MAAYVFDGATTDGYQQLTCPNTTRVTLQVGSVVGGSLVRVLVGFGYNPSHRDGAGEFPYPDEPFFPVLAGLARRCDVIRFKSFTPGQPAQITIAAR
jgi:hypothetical protein